MHIPLLIKDETLYGVLARGMHVNGYGQHLYGVGKLSGQRVTSLANLKAEALLNSDYLIGLGSKQNLGVSLLEQHLGAEQHIDHDLVSYSSGRVINGAWKTCRLCIKEDTNRYGIGTWHLSHQLPTTLVCPLHDELLSVHGLKRKMLHDRFYLPVNTSDSPQSIDYAVRYHIEKLAHLGQEAVADKSDPHQSKVIKQVFKKAMQERGLLKGNCLPKRIQHNFLGFFGPLNLSNAMGINLVRLLTGILENDDEPVTHRLLLVYWWFGSWQLFKSVCFWQNIFCEQENSNKKTEGLGLRSYFRERCLDYIETVEGADRSMLLKEEYKVFRWLKNNDRKWLDKQLPLVKQIQYGLF